MKTRKLLSFLLALVMAFSLAVPAFAAEGDPPEKELRWVHLDGGENGKFSASADALKNDNPGEGNGTEYDTSRQDIVLFFIWNNKTNKREGYVVPTAGDGLVVEKLPKEAIASGAKQSQYYVTLRMTEFKDSELTSKDLSFHVTAKLGLFGFYSAETPSADAILFGEVAAADLTDSTLYLCAPYMGTDEADQHDAVTKVEKDPNLTEPNMFYDLEKVKDGLWKITINDVGKIALKNGGFPINLNVEIKQPDGNTRQDGRNIFIRGEEQAPQLVFADLAGEWDDDAGHDLFFVNRDYGGQIGRTQVHAGYERVGIFGTVKEGEDIFTDHGLNWDALVPVDVDSLKVPDGLTVESLADQARKGENWGKYFVRVSVAENGKEYTVTSGDNAIIIDSGLPEIGIYSADTASLDTWCGQKLPYHPAYADETYYIISTAADDGMNNRHLTDAKLSAANEENATATVDLEKVNDNVYKLTLKKDAEDERDWFRVELDLTWTDFRGNTYTETRCYAGDFERQNAVVASDTALTDGTADEPEQLEFDTVADKVSDKINLTVGEKKDVYLYLSRFFGREKPSWKVWPYPYGDFRSTDSALTVTGDETDYSKYTLSASKPGTYEIMVGNKAWDYENLKLFHADGKAYTDAEMQKFNEEVGYVMDDEGVLYVVQDDKEVPFTEVYPGETYEIEDLGWQENTYFKHVTVTVTGEAKTFTDVKEDDWFYNEVYWAVAQGITAGTGPDTFTPNRDCTHVEILTFLWRAAGEPESTAELPFTPENDWAAGALAWAYEKGMIGEEFDENTKCTSSDAVTYIWQANDKPDATYDGRFTDVAEDAAYASAVAWAVETGVTVGTSETTFAPDTICSRARIVTFLYRAFNK